MQKSADLKVFNEKLVKPRNCDRGPDSPASAMPPVSPKKENALGRFRVGCGMVAG